MKQLKVDRESPDFASWTTRGHMGGVPIQRNPEWCFQNTNIDLRWLEFARDRKIDPIRADASGFPSLVSDIRQSVQRQQRANGSATLLSGSKIFSYSRNRALIGRENLRQQVWMSVVLEGISEDLPEYEHPSKPKRYKKKVPPTSVDAAEVPLAKKRRTGCGRKQSSFSDTTVKELAGQAMVLPDVVSIILCALYAVDSDLWTNKSSNLQFKSDLKTEAQAVFQTQGAGVFSLQLESDFKEALNFDDEMDAAAGDDTHHAGSDDE